jgi:glycine/D-amino acid oxidase-like deaminating enzyme
MNRRSWLKLVAGLAAGTALGANQPRTRALRVVVAGAGIVGASIAYHLAKAGAAVTVIDKLAPATHASRGTFAWINATWAKQPRSHHALNQAGVAHWHVLQQELRLPVRWGGSLEWFAEPGRQEQLVAKIAEQRDWGERARMVSAPELSALEPQVNFAGAQQVAFSENDGAVDPVRATLALLQAAKSLGAKLRYPCELTGVSLRAGRLMAVDTNRGAIKADRLVLATGAAPDAAKRFADTDLPQRSTPGIIAITAPMPRLVNRVIATPGVHLYQRDDGRIVLGEQDGPPRNEAHAERLRMRPNDFPVREIALLHAQRILAVAKQYLPAIGDAAIEAAYVGWRPLPLDGLPVLGASPARRDVYLAVMHSGVTLAPIAGLLAAQELVESEVIERLRDFRPGRQFDYIKRY